MSVAELMAALAAMPPNADVYHECEPGMPMVDIRGCRCVNAESEFGPIVELT